MLAVLVAAGKTAPDIQSVIDFARQQIGGYKIPRQMVFVDELPKSALGKVLKSELRSFYGISQTTQEHLSSIAACQTDRNRSIQEDLEATRPNFLTVPSLPIG